MEEFRYHLPMLLRARPTLIRVPRYHPACTNLAFATTLCGVPPILWEYQADICGVPRRTLNFGEQHAQSSKLSEVNSLL
eukprot:2134041-Rhodomonas_salina.1